MADKEERLISSISIGFYSFLPAVLFFLGWFRPGEELKSETAVLFCGWVWSSLIGVLSLLWVWVFSEPER